MPRVEVVLLIVALLFLLSILAGKASTRFGIPALLLFAVIGMLAGSDGPGGLYFDYPWIAQLVGVTALVLILFAAGFETDVREVRPVLASGLSLATVGVVISTAIAGAFASWLLRLDLAQGLLVGAIISSTDAAAVFTVLRSRGIQVRSELRQVLELESGSNDPMAVLLTVVLISLVQHPEITAGKVAVMLLQQLAVGALAGLVMGWATVHIINRIRLQWDGLYPVLSVTMALGTYGIAGALGGSGFLAAYLAGLIAGNRPLIHRTTLRMFHDGLAWLMQIAMFLVLGLQVFPSQLPDVAGAGLALAAFLMLVARPASVFLSLPGRRFGWREKLFICWAGLRGAAPIMLATFPLLAGLEHSRLMFNMVFFVALASLLVHGTSLPAMARGLRLQVPERRRRAFPLQFNPAEITDRAMIEVEVRTGSRAEGSRVVDLRLPKGTLINLLSRSNQFIVPEGSTVLRHGDVASILTTRDLVPQIRELFER